MFKMVIKNTSIEQKEHFGDAEGVNTEFAVTSVLSIRNKP